MIIFFSFLFVYGSAYVYLFFKLSEFLRLNLPGYFAFASFLIFMALSPILIHAHSMKSSEKEARFFAYIGYMWMGFLIIFIPTAIFLDLYNLIVQYSFSLFGKDVSYRAVSQLNTIFIPVLVSIVLNIFGWFEAKRLQVERVVVKTPKLPSAVNRIKIAQIADLHLGIFVGGEALDRVITKIEFEQPDIIISTGDLLDGAVHHIEHLAKKLKQVHAPMGKFAVMGNHEFMAGLKHSLKFLEEAGFVVLRGSGVTLDEIINIAGVDYYDEIKKENEKSASRETEVLSSLPAGIFTILLKHRTDINEDSLGLFDLQLSGHTHKGQIFPVNLLTPFIFKYHHAFISLPKGSALYVSRGAGTAGPPVRFLSPPELTIIEVVSIAKQ